MASFVTSVMRPGAVTVAGGTASAGRQGLVTSGIGGQVAPSKTLPDLSRFKALWKKAVIPGQ